MRSFAPFLLLVLAAGCAVGTTLDDVGDDDEGGAGDGSSNDGESSSAGGSECPSGEKSCDGECVAASPEVGCSATDCAPCPAPPANSTPFCNFDVCDFACLSGYEKKGGACEPAGAGGASSGSGSSSTATGTSSAVSSTSAASGGGMPCLNCMGTCALLTSDATCFVDCVGNQGASGCIWNAPTCTCVF
jgi:hypothetical protein